MTKNEALAWVQGNIAYHLDNLDTTICFDAQIFLEFGMMLMDFEDWLAEKFSEQFFTVTPINGPKVIWEIKVI